MKLISNQKTFYSEFERCSKEFTHLEIFTAWVGNPGNILPYSYLENLKSVEIHLGISFDNSSPEGIEYLMDNNYKVVIVNDTKTYHPKLYFFRSKDKIALIIGSSNFTYSGFFDNFEANVLLEGNEYEAKIKLFYSEINQRITQLKTFTPDKKWLNSYTERYKARQEKIRQFKLKEEASKEDLLIKSSSWLGSANWEIYLKQLNIGLKWHKKIFGSPLEKHLDLLSEYSLHLKTPWSNSIFDTIENRRRILGINPYGWLGHIGASGRFRGILKNGTLNEKRTIVNSINRIAEMQNPLNYNLLKKELEKLTQIGPTMKVWGRILTLINPSTFCTISSPDVRHSLSVLLEMPESYFETINGYIELLKLIHNSPWFNAKMHRPGKLTT